MAQLKHLHHKYTYKGKTIRANMEINLGRFEEQYSRAQYTLDSMVMTDMVPYMPMDTGQFINVTKAMSASIAGSGKVIAAAPPFGRFLYNGKVMIGHRTKSPWADPGERKIVTDQNITYSRDTAQAHWFDASKKKNLRNWVKVTRKIAGGGK